MFKQKDIFLITTIPEIAMKGVTTPVFIVLAVSLIFPLMFGVAYSFGLTGSEDAALTASTYLSFFQNSYLVEFKLLLYRALSASVLSLIISIPCAYWVCSLSRNKQHIALAVIIAPWIINELLRAFGWYLTLSPDGWLSKTYELISGERLYSLRFNRYSTLLALYSSVLPASIFCIYLVLPKRGDTTWFAINELSDCFNRIRLSVTQSSRSGFLLAFVFSFLFSFFSYAESKFLDGPTQSSIKEIISSVIYLGVDYALAFTFFVFISVLAFLVFFITLCWGLMPKMVYIIQNTNFFSKKIFFKRQEYFSFTIFLIFLINIAILYLPMLAICTEAFMSSHGFSLHNFRELFSSKHMALALYNSLSMAIIVAITSTCLSFFLGLMAFNQKLLKILFIFLAFLFVLPGDSFSLSLMAIANFFGNFQSGVAVTLLAQILWVLPYSTSTIIASNLLIKKNIILSSVEVIGRPGLIALNVIFRNNKGVLTGVFLFNTMLALNESVRSFYLLGNTVTISNLINSNLNHGFLQDDRSIFALLFLLIFSSLFSTFIYFSLFKLPKTLE